MECRPILTALALLTAACGGPSRQSAEPAPRGPASPASYSGSLRARLGAEGALTLVPRLQAAAETAVRATGRAGAVVALSPDTGAVLAVFSTPGDRGDPLLVAHQPASTFKPFTALVALETGVITKATEKECTGRYAFAGKDFTCSKEHGRETVGEAIVRSCNVFFYGVGAEMDHARVLEVAQRFGFGSRTGIELPDEAGVVPGPVRYEEIKREPTNPVPLLDAIGHGEIQVTLLQLARAYAVFANGGKVLRLTLRRSPSTPALARTLDLNPEYLELVRGALIDTVATEAGTAHSVAISGFDFAAKTGSADSPPRGASVSTTTTPTTTTSNEEDTWFVAYAPPRSPSVLVAVRIERGEAGRDAKTVGKQVLEAWRDVIPAETASEAAAR